MSPMPENREISRWFILIIVLTQNGYAEESDELDSMYRGKEKEIEMQSLAAGHPVPENLSPGVTSIISSKDIELIGARRLNDILEYLPGVHVGSARNGISVIGFRGIYSENTAQVLVLVNGIPIRNTLIGGRPFEWTMPVKNISHIEVIRGPNSMLYGGDATMGVINVILKSGKEMQGGDIGGIVGSQDTYEGWSEYGRKKGDWEYSFSLQGGSTNGNQGRIGQDAQTFLDKQFGSLASKAPGLTNNGRDDMDARVDVAYKDWGRLRAGYQLFNKVQTGEGAALALDNIGRNDEHIYNVDLTLTNKIATYLHNYTTFYFLGQNQNSKGNLLPSGTMGGLLPQGVYRAFQAFQDTTGLTTQFNYTGIKKHTFTAGAGLIYNWISDASNKTNAIITPTFIQQINLTSISALGTDPLLASKNRTSFYALIQDEWNFTTDWYATTGFRYDYYSDVAPGFSPRAALIWHVNPMLTSKLLYSRAFRPPSFLEKNQPLIAGTIIKPETVNTVEIQIENKWSPHLKTSTNVYWFQMDNMITSTSTNTITPVGFINNNPITGVGLETEAQYKANDDLNLSVNYSYHGLPNSTTTGLMPEHMIKSLINWEFTKDWRLGSQINWIGDRKRPSNDPRRNLSGYVTVGLTLSTQIAKPLEFTLRANNLFNSLSNEPSLDSALLPGDVPMLERSLLGQIKWSF